jgi:integrase
MAKKTLTDIGIQNLKPRAKRYEVPDPDARGLRVVVQPSGRKSFAVRYRNATGRARKLTLPAGITLAAARKLAADALLEVAQSKDPAVIRQETRRTSRARAEDTVKRLAEQFVEQYAKRKTRKNSWRATEGIFKNHILPKWSAHSVHEIRRRDVIDLIEAIAVKHPSQANRAHAVLSKFFKWLCQRDVLEASPCTGVEKPSKETARERALDDAEIRRLWLAAEKIGGRKGACYKLLMLTGMRRSEIGHLKWKEVGDALELPAERMKGKRAHMLPLSTQAAAIIADMPKLVPQVPRPNDYIWGRTAITQFHDIKAQLDAHMGAIPNWVTHDIRRSVASGMARIGIALPVIEKILAHRSGSFAGIVAVYQRHSFLPEMADALQRWADHIDAIVSGKTTAKVMSLRRDKRA